MAQVEKNMDICLNNNIASARIVAGKLKLSLKKSNVTLIRLLGL